MPSLCDPLRSVLVVIDMQERLLPAIHDADAVLRNAQLLARTAKRLEVPVIATVQHPAGLGQTVPTMQALCDQLITKMHFSACGEPAFLDALPPERDDIIVLGCEAHVCVLQTVVDLLSRGKTVRLVADASGSRAIGNHAAALQRAQAAGADIVTTEMVVYEWLGHCRHAAFKDVLGWVKGG